MTFYSKIGKKRLKIIWTENDLDQENIFSSWLGVGPSSTLINEKVTDYMQSYLLVKNKTIQSLNNSLYARLRNVGNYDEFFDSLGFNNNVHKKKEYYFKTQAGAHQALYDRMTNNRVAARREAENERIKSLIINRKMKAPPGFKNPILKLNILNEKIAELEELEQRLSNRIRLKGLPSIKKEEKWSKFIKTTLNESEFIDKGIPEENSKAVVHIPDEKISNQLESLDMEAAEKSVDHKEKEFTSPSLTPTSLVISPISPVKIRVTSEDDLFFDNFDFEELSSLWELDQDKSRSYSSHIDDNEIFAEAKMFNFYETSGDVEHPMELSFSSPLVERVFEQPKNVSMMFDKAYETVLAHRRQYLTARDELYKLNRLFPLW